VLYADPSGSVVAVWNAVAFHGQTFMARWSRRKRASAQEGESAEPSAPADDAAAEAVEHALAAAAGDARPSDAPASHEDARPVPQLPSIESIVAESDVRAFLVLRPAFRLNRPVRRYAAHGRPATGVTCTLEL
jgi:hypothetical protein